MEKLTLAQQKTPTCLMLNLLIAGTKVLYIDVEVWVQTLPKNVVFVKMKKNCLKQIIPLLAKRVREVVILTERKNICIPPYMICNGINGRSEQDHWRAYFCSPLGCG